MDRSKIKFTAPESGFCPQYYINGKTYVIRDRMSGKDIHGHDSYDYALFELPKWQIVFVDMSGNFDKLDAWLRENASFEWLKYAVTHSPVGNFWDYRGEHDVAFTRNDVIYKVDWHAPLTVRTRPDPKFDKRLTPWMASYREALELAKDYLAEHFDEHGNEIIAEKVSHTPNWRNDPITEKQKKLIAEMQEFSDFPLPAFRGTTKGEAADYIDAHLRKAHESLDDNECQYGDRS